ncbi:fumarylacetoacetate hydrolase family protein [Bacillus sp. CECT 9360]|uniref:fumarylacetoacetate hydrolase family protein n=1 Tax=Bacillus sp. CECT 9360 TaxID=2845821 RepID=UPI001E29DDC8|nr:fumarylacetoacetate hydrolase family protein [Bacillus sp. CECT 9360]CAH0343843.1 putative protein YisK [Bacillus sp. CECT 9360]
MKLVTFRDDSGVNLGIIKNDQIFSLSALDEWDRSLNQDDANSENPIPLNTKSFIEEGENALAHAERLLASYEEMGIEEKRKAVLYLNETELLAPISQPEKIICVGLNYLDHCKETGMEPPKSPVVFSKYANAIIGHQQSIELPVNSDQVDFEAELAVVIGKEAKRVSVEEASDYIFGYTIMNDVSARDIQFADGQWVRGKTADTFAPLGPCIVTQDEIEDPHKLNISLTLNGEVMQQSNTSNLIFTVPYIISFLSQAMTLKPGDIIATGTPPGVGMGREPKIWLKKGDELSITIEKLGTLSNSVK